jgi:hypothetical protein
MKFIYNIRVILIVVSAHVVNDRSWYKLILVFQFDPIKVQQQLQTNGTTSISSSCYTLENNYINSIRGLITVLQFLIIIVKYIHRNLII